MKDDWCWGRVSGQAPPASEPRALQLNESDRCIKLLTGKDLEGIGGCLPSGTIRTRFFHK
jgi:hypothetical protein